MIGSAGMPETEEDDRRFALAFVAASEQYRSQYVDRWREVIANLIVEPEWVRYNAGMTPYATTGQGMGRAGRRSKRQIVLKDPETHKIVMTYASKLLRATFGDTRREYVQSEPVGYEDVLKARTTTKLLRYNFSRPGHYRSIAEAFVDMLCFGTSIVESPWKYEEREIPTRSVEIMPDGSEQSRFSTQTVPSYDDVCIRVIDIEDFYPDPSRYRMEEMTGAAKRFRINWFEAKRRRDWPEDAVKKAFDKPSGGDNMRGGTSSPDEASFRRGLDQPANKDVPTDFRERTGIQYWGDSPRGLRRITIINTMLVESIPWPHADYALPFHAATINPVVGRFYGIAPAEIVRYDQSFADAIKILLAEAIIRQVHPPLIIDDASDIDQAALREWKADAPIAVKGGTSGIATLQYNANVANGFSMLAGLKDSMQGASGALGALQGAEGPDREAATVGAQRYQMALDRPEMAARLLEEDFLPSLAKGILRRSQQFLDTEGLKLRVGEMPEPYDIADIMGDFDVRFVGSRMAMSRQAKVQAFQTAMSFLSQIPAAQAMMPTAEIMAFLFGDLLELPELAGQIGNPAAMQANVMAMEAFGRPAGGSPQATPPTGGIPVAQAAGGTP